MPRRYSAKAAKNGGVYSTKPKDSINPEGYTVPRSKWCKAPLLNGQECKAAKVSGKDGCVHHNSKDGGKYTQEIANAAADKFVLPEMELNTVQDVITFLGKLIMCFKSGGVDKEAAKTLGGLCRELLSAMKERDSNSPEGVAKKREEIMAVVMAAKQLGIEAAREVLLSRNFDLLEVKAIEMTQEAINAEVIQPETSTQPATGEASSEGSEA